MYLRVIAVLINDSKPDLILHKFLKCTDQFVDGFVLTGTNVTCHAGADIDRKSTRLNSSHANESRMPSSA